MHRLRGVALSDIPRHVAIIMDGNGRWARARRRPRAFGHREGVNAVRRAVRAAGDMGVRELTLFGFSTENWSRPAQEVADLLDLLRRFVDADLDRLSAEGVRVRILGRREGLSDELIEIIERAEARTRANDAFVLNVAFNYGSRDEITRAAKALAEDVRAGALSSDDVTIEALGARLDTAGSPDPDLVIRTSGEQRLSNFLLWQAAYAEFVFLDVLWPDFSRDHLEAAVAAYQRRERRYGGVGHVEGE